MYGQTKIKFSEEMFHCCHPSVGKLDTGYAVLLSPTFVQW